MSDSPVPIDPFSVLHKKDVTLLEQDKEDEFVNALAGYFNMRGRVVQQEMKVGADRPWKQLANGEIEGFKPDDSKG